MAVCALSRFDDHINASFILLDHGQRAAGCLQQRRKLRFDESTLLFGVAHVSERWAHIKRAADLTFEQHVITAQVNFGGFARGLQLLQMAIAEFVPFIPLIADGLSISNALGNGRR